MPIYNLRRLSISSAIDADLLAKHKEKILGIFQGVRSGACFEKLSNGLYSARGGSAVRYILARKEDGSFVLIGITETHDYDKCTKFYNAYQKDASESDSLLVSDKTETALDLLGLDLTEYRHDSEHDRAQRIIFLTDNQEDAFKKILELRHSHPFFVNGIAGSGKTSIAHLLLGNFNPGDKVLYLCPNDSLAAEQSRIYEVVKRSNGAAEDIQDDVAFRSVRQFYQDMGILEADTKVEDFSIFCTWLNDYFKLQDDTAKHAKKQFSTQEAKEALYNEFKSILSRGQQVAVIGSYQKLSVDLSLYEKGQERELVFTLYASYLRYLATNRIACLEKINPEMFTDEIKAQHAQTRILIDEVQSLPCSALGLLSHLSTEKLVLFGDFNQAKFYFRYQDLTEVFKELKVINLTENFRNSKPVADFANGILELKRAFMSGQFESACIPALKCQRLDDSLISDSVGVEFLDVTQESKLHVDNNTVFITKDVKTRDEILGKYQERLCTFLLPEQIQGLEFDNVVLYKFITQQYDVFAKDDGVEEMLEGSAKHTKEHKPKDKVTAAKKLQHVERLTDLFVAITRARNGVVLVGEREQKFIKVIRRLIGQKEYTAPDSLISTEATSLPLELNYENVLRLLQSSGAFDEGKRQIEQFLKTKQSGIIKQIIEKIDSIKKSRLNVKLLREIVNASSLSELDSVRCSDDKYGEKDGLDKPMPPHIKDKSHAAAGALAGSIGFLDGKLPALEHARVFQSIYGALACCNVSIKGNLLKHSLSVKTLIFDKLPEVKSRGKSKCKTTGDQEGLRKLGAVEVSRSRYIKEEVAISVEARDVELETFAQASGHMVVLIDKKTNEIKYYNQEAKEALVILRSHDKGADNFKGCKLSPEQVVMIKRFSRVESFSQKSALEIDLLLNYGLVLQNVPGDGHCFYHAIMLSGPEYNGNKVAGFRELRSLAAEELESNPASRILTGDDRDTYLNGVRGTQWGGQEETFALSVKLGRPIVVIENPNLAGYKIYNRESNGHPIFLYYNGSNHYQALLPARECNPMDLLAAMKKTEQDREAEQAKKDKKAEQTVKPKAQPKPPTVSAEHSGGVLNTVGFLGSSRSPIPNATDVRNVMLQAVTNAPDNPMDVVLRYAVQEKNLDVVQRILSNPGFNINQADTEGITVLMTAAIFGHSAIVEILLKKGAELNKQNNKGFTAVMLAAFNGHVAVVEKLIAKGANLKLVDKNGNTVLYLAAQHGNPDIVSKLLDAGCEVDFQNSNKITALMVAAQYGRLLVVKTLLKAKADVNKSEVFGLTSLIVAASKGYLKVVQKLLKKGALVDQENQAGFTALMVAAQDGRTDVVDELLTAGADLNYKNHDKNTALILAAMSGFDKVVKTLIEKGAEVDHRNINGDTALMLADKNGHTEVKRILEEASRATRPALRCG